MPILHTRPVNPSDPKPRVRHIYYTGKKLDPRFTWVGDRAHTDEEDGKDHPEGHEVREVEKSDEEIDQPSSPPQSTRNTKALKMLSLYVDNSNKAPKPTKT